MARYRQSSKHVLDTKIRFGKKLSIRFSDWLAFLMAVFCVIILFVINFKKDNQSFVLSSETSLISPTPTPGQCAFKEGRNVCITPAKTSR